MLLLKVVTFTLLLTTCAAGEHNVAEYTDIDFASQISEHEIALVMFYAPWCRHCKMLKLEFAMAAQVLFDNDPRVVLAKVDCNEGGKDTCSKFEVSGYPTLKIFRHGEFSKEYAGPRDAPGIVKYMKSQVGPSSKEISSEAELDNFLSAEIDQVTVVGFFEEQPDLESAFLNVSDKLREKVRFAHSSLGKQGIVLFRPILLRNTFEDDNITYSGDASREAIEEFITKNYHGLSGYRNPGNRQDFNEPLVVAYYSLDYVKNPKGTKYWRNRILKAAKSFRDSLTFAVSSKHDFRDELQEYDIDFLKDDKPIVIASGSNNEKYVMKTEFSVDSLESFAKDVLAQKLEPYLKSEPIPDSNDGPVLIAVAKNFNEVVLNNEKDVLIEFYAPWCGHCKKLASVYDKVGEKFKNEDVAIVKFDATANGIPASYELREYPTIFWLPKDSKQNPVKYDGGHKVNDFVKYVSKHATYELKGFDRKGNKRQKTEL